MNTLAQSIYIDSRAIGQRDGIYLSKVETWSYHNKAPKGASEAPGGIRFYIRPMEGTGFLPEIIPGSEVLVKASTVPISNSPLTKPNNNHKWVFEFQAPVYLELGKQYAFFFEPEDRSPNIALWTYVMNQASAGGAANSGKNNVKFNTGNLYLAASGTALPTENEVLMMRLFSARHQDAIVENEGLQVTPANTIFHNDDYEFFESQNTVGIFTTGETVIKEQTSLSTDVTISSKRYLAQRSDLVDNLVAYRDGDITVDLAGNAFDAAYYDINNGGNNAGSLDEVLLLKWYNGQAAFSDLSDAFVQYVRENYIIEDSPDFNKTYVYGNTTTFTSEFNVGDVFTVVDGNGDVQDNLITEIVSDTVLVVKDNWKLTNTSGGVDVLSGLSYYAAPTVAAKVESYNSIQETFVCNESNAANTTHLFANNDTIIGTTSQATANVNVVPREVSYAQLISQRFEPPRTAVYQDIKFNAASASSKFEPYEAGQNLYMTEDVQIKSRSDEIRDDLGVKSLSVSMELVTMDPYSSPQVLETSVNLGTYKNLVQSTVTGETGINGTATSKVVTKAIQLPNNITAEDLSFFMDAYRPANTSIDVYVKLLGAYDADELLDKDWSPLAYLTESENKRSSSVDIFDVKEFALGIPIEPPNTDAQGSGLVETGNTSIVISNTDQFAVGDVIMINDANDADFHVTTVTDTTSTVGEIVVANALTYSQDGDKRIRIVTQPRAAFKYSKNDSIVRYLDSNLTPIDGYNSYQFKIVLRADNHFSVPRVENYRAITTTV